MGMEVGLNASDKADLSHQNHYLASAIYGKALAESCV